MAPSITSVNGIDVVTIPNVGAIAPVFITPEQTLTIRGTGLSKDSALAAIGLNVVNTPTVNVSVRAFNIGKSIDDLFGLLDGSWLGGLLQNLDDVMTLANKKADILRAPEAKYSAPDQLRAYVPSVWEFQTTHLDLFGFQCRYERNTILMPFAICVWDSKTLTHSTPVIIAVMLPPPAVGKPHYMGRTVLIGAVPGPSSDTTDHFGALEPKDASGARIPGTGGQVRWYDPSTFFGLSLVDISTILGSAPVLSIQQTDGIKEKWARLIDATSKPGQSLLGKVFDGLAEVRETGELLTVLDWHNEGVLFEMPAKKWFGTAGVAVVWRDDIPSLPVTILNLACDCSNPKDRDEIQALIQDAAARLWSFVPSIDLDVPVLPGEAVTFGLQKLAAGLDSLVERLLRSSETGLTVKFKFAVNNADRVAITKVSQDSATKIQAGKYSSEAVPMDVDPTRSFQIKIVAMPDLVPQENPGQDKDITIQLYAEIAFSPSCVFTDIAIGPSFTFHQKPIGIPTLAIFFTGDSCGSVPLFMLPNDTGIPGLARNIHWDIRDVIQATTSGGSQDALKAMNDIRVKILSTLIMAKNAMDLVKLVTEEPHWMEQLEGVLAFLIRSASFVVDTTGSIYDTGQCVYGSSWGNAETFGRRIESVLLIGPPSELSGKCLKCYDMLGGTGNELKLTIPANTCVAGLATLRMLQVPLVVGNSSLPAAGSEQNPPAPPNFWGGRIASIYFDTTE